jgi:hypothetical protein
MTTTDYEWSDIEPLLGNLTHVWETEAEITDEIDDDTIDQDYQCVGEKATERCPSENYGTFAIAINVSVASIRASEF